MGVGIFLGAGLGFWDGTITWLFGVCVFRNRKWSLKTILGVSGHRRLSDVALDRARPLSTAHTQPR